jgi:hypothetical protein
MSASIPSARMRFYPLIAIVLVAFIVIGFSRTYYLRFLSDLPPMRAVLQLHGLIFTAWLALFVAQTQLIAAHRVDLHRNLGVVGVFLSLVIVATSVMAMLAAAATPRVSQLGLTSPQASIVPVVAITQFAVLVTAGVAMRRRASLHKRFMLLAMIGVLGPPTARLIGLFAMRKYFLLIQMTVVALFVTCCLVYDWRKNRVVHPVFAIGGVVLVLLWPLRYAVARSEMWQPIGQWFAKVGQHLLEY